MRSGRAFLLEQARQAAELGHQLAVEQYGQGGVKFRAMCSCGYASTQRRTHALALGAGFHHLGQVAADARRDGATTVRTDRRVVDADQAVGL